jgi:hypothetical protein
MSDEAETWYFRRRWDGFRSGEKRIRLLFGAEHAIARLYDKGVPETCREILSHLPLTVPVVHVAWSGDMVMSARPFHVGPREPENAVRLPRPGDLTWDPKFGEICFAYGTARRGCRRVRINSSSLARLKTASSPLPSSAGLAGSTVSAKSASRRCEACGRAFS